MAAEAAAAVEEFAKLTEKEQFVCDSTKVRREWQMRKIEEWPGKQEINKDTPVYCFAICPSPWPGENKDDDDDDDDDDQESGKQKGFQIKIFILVPEDCSIYHFANFRAPTHEIACVGADSKIYLFGGGCGTRVWYMDVVREGNSQRGNKWKEAKECLNSEKCHPLSFSLGSKIYALETRNRYLPPSSNGITEELDGGEVNGYWFEVLDTSTDGSSWLPLCNPPYPFGACTVLGSWASDGSGDQAGCYLIFIQASFRCYKYLFVYDVGAGTWDKFKLEVGFGEALVKYPVKLTGYRPSYPWAVHLAGKDFAPFPPHVPYTGDLRVLTGLKSSIPDLKQAASECEKGLQLLVPVPVPVKVDTDKKKAVIVRCQNSPFSLTGWHLESLWTLHCLPVEKLIFWQAIHLGGSSFCTLAFYDHTNCCTKHRPIYVRVSRFNITDAAAAGVSGPIFSATYGTNKVYLATKSCMVFPLPCSRLHPV